MNNESLTAFNDALANRREVKVTVGARLYYATPYKREGDRLFFHERGNKEILRVYADDHGARIVPAGVQ